MLARLIGWGGRTRPLAPGARLRLAATQVCAQLFRQPGGTIVMIHHERSATATIPP